MNAILGTGGVAQDANVGASTCIAVHTSDMAVAMRVLGAKVETLGAQGTARVIPIADFHRLPGATPDIETALQTAWACRPVCRWT